MTHQPSTIPDLDGTGIDRSALERYIEEQIYTLPGTDRHGDEFTILLTGSRAYGDYKPTSDVDIDVICPRSVFDSVLRAANESGLIKSTTSFWCSCKDEDWWKYFGKEWGRPHFSITPLETVERQLAEYEDVPLWIWTNARIIADPGGQFARIRDGFQGYPRDVLDRKIKYYWLMSGYWAVDGYPGSHADDSELLAAASSVLNGWNDTLRMCFLVEGKPFPYLEKLMSQAQKTALGRQILPLVQRSVDLVIGKAGLDLSPWDRLDKAMEPMRMQDPGTEGEWYWNVCADAMLAAGLDKAWVEADYDNIDELLNGSLGPPP